MTTTLIDRRNGIAEGLAVKAPCRVATTANIALSGEQTIDGVAVVSGDRVLVKDQTTGSQNGVYDCSTGNWTRSADFDGSRDIVTGTRVFVTSGTVNAANEYAVSTSGTISIGTSSIAFTASGAPAFGAKATQAEAVAGTNNTHWMTPLRTAQEISASDVLFYYPELGATLANAIAAQPDGGIIYVPPGDPVLLTYPFLTPASFEDYAFVYSGPAYFDTYGESIVQYNIQHGPQINSGKQRYGVGIRYETDGTGVDGPTNAAMGFFVRSTKKGWDAGTATDGEVWGAAISARQGGSNGQTSDSIALGLSNISVGMCGSISLAEGDTLNYNANLSLRRQITTQFNIQNNVSGNDFAYGAVFQAIAGTTTAAISIGNSGGTFTTAIQLAAGSTIGVDGSIVLGGATGDNKGAGTINAKDVYNDNVALTCMALADQFFKSGTVDLDYWDSLVPDDVIPEHTKRWPVYEKDLAGNDRQVFDWEPIFKEIGPKIYEDVVTDKAGKTTAIKRGYLEGTGALPTPVMAEIVVPEQRTPRVHKTARLFKAMLDEGFDPRDPAQYVAKLKRDEALPGMPTKDEWQHNAFGMGELHSRMWLATEMLALVVIKQQERMDDIERRLKAGGL